MHRTETVLLILPLCVLGIALIGAVLRYAYFYKKEHFVCPNCGCRFRPRAIQMIFSVNAVEGKIIACPKCGIRDYMEPVKDQK